MTNVVAFDIEEYRARRVRLGLDPRPWQPRIVAPAGRALYAKPIGPRCPQMRWASIYEAPIGPPHLIDAGHRARFIRDGLAQLAGISVSELVGQQRGQRIVRVRHYAVYLVAAVTGWSLPHVGRFFGGRNHTSVLHAIRKVKSTVEGIEYKKSYGPRERMTRSKRP